MVQSFLVKMDNMEVRKVEQVESVIDDKTYRKLEIHFDNENSDRIVLTDKDVNNLDKYKRGTVGTVVLQISIENQIKTSKNGTQYIAEKTKLNIEDFIVG